MEWKAVGMVDMKLEIKPGKDDMTPRGLLRAAELMNHDR